MQHGKMAPWHPSTAPCPSCGSWAGTRLGCCCVCACPTTARQTSPAVVPKSRPGSRANDAYDPTPIDAIAPPWT